VVEDNQIIQEIRANDGEPLTALELEHFLTVDELFDKIDRLRASNPHRLEIDYDARYGYPKRIDYEYSEFTEDDFDTFILRDLQQK
jgi:hypothetical protein